MEVRNKKIEVYVVGGKEFLNKEEAKRYEEKLNQKLKYTYYIVSYKPDLNEGRGYYRKMIVVVDDQFVSNALLQFLVTELGRPVEMVYGVDPINNWLVSKPYKFNSIDELGKFLSKERTVGFGDFRKPKVLEVVYVNDRGERLNV